MPRNAAPAPNSSNRNLPKASRYFANKRKIDRLFVMEVAVPNDASIVTAMIHIKKAEVGVIIQRKETNTNFIAAGASR